MNVRRLLAPAAVTAVALAIWYSSSSDSPGSEVPACTWRIGSGTDSKQGRNYDELPADSPLRLSFACSEPRFVYVFSHSAEDGTVLLHPSPDVKSDLAQPLPPGQHVLPGRHADKDLAWTSRSGVRATQTLIAVAAREPVPELEALAAKVRRWSNSVFGDGSMLVTKQALGAVDRGPFTPLAEPLLLRASEAGITAVAPNGPMLPDAQRPGVWSSSWRIVEQKGTAPPPLPNSPQPATPAPK
jgi:hypothetical protein